MTKFDELLKLEEPLKTDKFGKLIVDKKHKGTKDDPFEMPYISYSETVSKLIEAVYNFCENNPDYNLYKYNEVLEKNGYRGELDKVDVSNIDDKCLMALFMALVRGERFCDGLIQKMLEAGVVQKWLKRLRELAAYHKIDQAIYESESEVEQGAKTIDLDETFSNKR